MLATLVKGWSLNDWVNLNATVGGRLQENVPMALPCFTRYQGEPRLFEEAKCTQIRLNYSSPNLRADIAGVTMMPQDEICLSNPEDQCLLDITASPPPIPAPNSSCNQGNVPSFVLAIQDASDIIAAFKFARQHNITISVKNSGHDYMTRSFQRGSLLLWVHNLQNMTHHTNFRPEGCLENDYGPALTIGTGVSSDAATAFATSHNATLLIGSSPTIAVSGGWVLGAGHSVLSPVYGLGVDRVVQFEIVTPDGILRHANACQNQDLFWALRGGGGGTFGVVLGASRCRLLSAAQLHPIPFPIEISRRHQSALRNTLTFLPSTSCRACTDADCCRQHDAAYEHLVRSGD